MAALQPFLRALADFAIDTHVSPRIYSL